MFDAEIFQQTVTLLSSYCGVKKVDPAFGQYQQGIERALNEFIANSMEQPLAEQLTYIERELKKRDGIPAALEEASDGKCS
ncbi:hypothetical protein [Legionella oakridgensis]|nr:hypothetical protein [Legionella oakridgensis]